MRQVERHLIKPSNGLYTICDDLTFKSKNLYNAGLYQIRQSIFERNKSDNENKKSVLNWARLVSEFRKQDQSDMKALPSKVSTNIIKMLGGNISSYYQLLKGYNDNSNKKIINKPKLPGYLHKTKGRYVVEFTNQTISILPKLLLLGTAKEMKKNGLGIINPINRLSTLFFLGNW